MSCLLLTDSSFPSVMNISVASELVATCSNRYTPSNTKSWCSTSTGTTFYTPARCAAHLHITGNSNLNLQCSQGCAKNVEMQDNQSKVYKSKNHSHNIHKTSKQYSQTDNKGIINLKLSCIILTKKFKVIINNSMHSALNQQIDQNTNTQCHLLQATQRYTYYRLFYNTHALYKSMFYLLTYLLHDNRYINCDCNYLWSVSGTPVNFNRRSSRPCNRRLPKNAFLEAQLTLNCSQFCG